MKRKYLWLLTITFLIVSLIFIAFPRKTYTIISQSKNEDSTIEIYGNKTAKQNFNTNFLTIDYIYINVVGNNENHYDGTAQVRMFKDKKNIFNDSVNFYDLKDNVLRINLPSIPNDGSTFQLEISCSTCTENSPLVLNTYRTLDKKNQIILNNDRTEEALQFSTYGKKSNYKYAICMLIIYFVCLIISLTFNVKVHNDTKLYRYFILEWISSLIMSITLLNLVCDYLYRYAVKTSLLILFIASATFAITFFIYIFKKKSIKKEQLYLNLMIPISICYVIAMIPNYVADEPAHFAHAYHLIDENILSTDVDVDVPNDFVYYNKNNVVTYNDLFVSFQKNTNYNNQEIKYHAPANTYSFVLYIFSGIGILIGKLLSLPIMLTYYIAQIFNSLAMIIIGYFIIKIIPFGKNIALIYLMNPMYVHQGVSVSADCMVDSICLLFIAIVFYLLSKRKYEKIDFNILFVFILLIGVAKYVYLPLLLLLLLFFSKKNTISLNAKKMIIIVSFISVIICFYSLFSIYIVPATKNGLVSITPEIDNVSMVGQLKYIIFHPLYAIKAIMMTLHLMLSNYIDTFFGMRLGWLNIVIRNYILWPYYFLFLTSPWINCKDDKQSFLRLKDKILCNILSFTMFFLVLLSMWLSWTSVGSYPILGVQGRYFLPIMLLPILTIYDKNKTLSFKNYDRIMAFLLCFVHIGVLLTIFRYFL